MVGCFVVGCKSGYKSGKQYHNFKIPRNATIEIRKKWLQNIPKRIGCEWDFKTCHICELHFEEKHIVKFFEVTVNGKIEKGLPRQRWCLRSDAVPTLFSNQKVPSYYDKVDISRPPPKARKTNSNLPSKKKQATAELSHPTGNITESEDYAAANNSVFQVLRNTNPPKNWFKQEKDMEIVFSKLVESGNEKLPHFHAERQVAVATNCEFRVLIRGNTLDTVQFQSSNQTQVTDNNMLNAILEKVDKVRICEGAKNFWMFPTFPGAYRCGESLISNQCTGLVENSLLCDSCAAFKSRLIESAKKELSRRSQGNIETHKIAAVDTLRKKNLKSMRYIRTLKTRNITLKSRLDILQKKFKNASVDSINDVIDKSNGLTPQFKLALKTAASLQKAKSPTGRRYPGDWLLQALLLKITSPKAYRHLRKEGILPLPHPKHITRMLQGIKCEFGFNDFVLSHLKQEFLHKPRRDRQVFLAFDEMKVKEAIDFSKSTMKFTGFVDYGEFSGSYVPRTGSKVEADHALVFMVRTLNSKLTQPIGTFAKYIISAILKLEGAGLEVAGVVSDGALSNKSAWKALGISGEHGKLQNKIPNPFDESRSVYFLCDVPHIFKCIRNHFQKQGVCEFNGHTINWGFYAAVYDMDKNQPLRVAPKLTQHHINPGPFQKMSVAKAVQIFSKTVADAIHFYRQHGATNFFKGSEATEDFTRQLNALFDSLNVGVSPEGLKPGNAGFKIIEDFLASLKSSDTFASDLTLASLRVTLQSTLDLITYLCGDVGYAYVLTSKFNQDCLERFFGLIRSFGGDNCHPTISTFGHLFRLLSVYNPTSRLIHGNVRNEELQVNVVSYLDMLKSLRSQQHIEAEQYKGVLETMLIGNIVRKPSDNTRAVLGFENDHVYCKPKVCQSLAYYLSGYVAFKASKFTDCQDCILGLSDDFYRPPECNLTDIKNMGGLKFPSRALYSLISKYVEPKLDNLDSKCASSPSFISDLVESLEIDCNGLGCSPEHSEFLAARIVLYYITIRMYFFSKIHNREGLSSMVKSKHKIKEGKLQ